MSSGKTRCDKCGNSCGVGAFRLTNHGLECPVCIDNRIKQERETKNHDIKIIDKNKELNVQIERLQEFLYRAMSIALVGEKYPQHAYKLNNCKVRIGKLPYTSDSYREGDTGTIKSYDMVNKEFRVVVDRTDVEALFAPKYLEILK